MRIDCRTGLFAWAAADEARFRERIAHLHWRDREGMVPRWFPEDEANLRRRVERIAAKAKP